ncbi:MAG: recombinase family protein [Firmicutes bacterium]|nr:recombinase family protein [Bacillota bacterium]
MEKAVIYARYSPGSKQTEQSIEGQVRDIESYCKANNYNIIGRYYDRKLTGRNDKRLEFKRLLKDSQKQLFKYVVVWQFDRFARNRYESAVHKNTLKKNGVKVLSAKEHIADDPSGILMETMLEGMAEYYSAELSQKIKRGMYEGFQKGHNAGGARCWI